MRNIKIILISAILLLLQLKNSIGQVAIGEKKTTIEEDLLKSSYKITKNTENKITAEFPEPKMLYSYYFKENICYKYEGLIPLTEKLYYIDTMIKNGWIKTDNEDERTQVYRKDIYILRVISLLANVGYFKFQIEKF